MSGKDLPGFRCAWITQLDTSDANNRRDNFIHFRRLNWQPISYADRLPILHHNECFPIRATTEKPLATTCVRFTMHCLWMNLTRHEESEKATPADAISGSFHGNHLPLS